MRMLSTVARLLVGGMFVYASFDKIVHPDQFVQNIIDYDLVPVPFARLMAYWLPWLEVSAGLMLLAGVWVRTNAVLLTGLLTVFILAISSAMIRGLSIECGCFETGDAGDTIGWSRLILDTVLLIPAIWLIYRPASKFAVSQE